jgi:hypothetical protein
MQPIPGKKLPGEKGIYKVVGTGKEIARKQPIKVGTKKGLIVGTGKERVGIQPVKPGLKVARQPKATNKIVKTGPVTRKRAGM